MNKHRGHLEKLGQDVQALEKKLEKVLKGNGMPVPGERKNKAARQQISAKHPICNSSKRKVGDQCKSKSQALASVEISVKTKYPEKSKKNNNKNIGQGPLVVTDPSNEDKLESYRSDGHCCYKPSSTATKNLMWGMILKSSASDDPKLISQSKEVEVTKSEQTLKCDSVLNNGNGELHSNPSCKNLVYGRPYSALSDGLEILTPEANTINPLSSKTTFQTQMEKCRFGPDFNNKELSKIEKHELLESKSESQRKPIETLNLLLEELNKKVTEEDESTRKLVVEMQLTLGNLMDTMSTAGVSSGNKLSATKSSSKEIAEDNFKTSRADEIKGNNSDGYRSEIPKTKRQKIFYENNLELPVKLKDDKETQINLSSEKDEKLKLEIESLKKQLSLQLKSVDMVTAKESEYHSLLISLVDKVKKLEDQINEQRKGAYNFLLQNNILKEQNNVIPALQASQDLLNKQLQETLRKYEQLKKDYCMLKLEKEKYCALNATKDKDIKRFQEQIRNVQLLVEEQMKYLKKVDTLEIKSNEAEALIDLINTQSHLIKSKFESVDLGEEFCTSNVSTPKHSTSSCEIVYPDFESERITAADPVVVSTLSSRNNVKDAPLNHYSLNVPELQSPNPS